MVTRLLRLLAVVCSVLVAAGWIWFAVDESSAASKNTTAEISGRQAQADPAPTPAEERIRERVDGKTHEAIDDANDLLLRPFVGVASSSSSVWFRRSVPALLALLVYGVGLSALARHLTLR